jgi:opacity protein-like surface antigen
MKKSLLLAVLFVSFTSGASAATIDEGRYNPKTNSIEFDVVYTGGCMDHDFVFELVNGCKESYPVQCTARLTDKTQGDFCEAIVNTTVSFTLEQAGLADSYYNGARLTVHGLGGSNVKFSLPFKR